MRLGNRAFVGAIALLFMTGSLFAQRIAAGYYHSLFVCENGIAWACGRNDDGQLGDGTDTRRTLPVQVHGLTEIVAVAAGQEHSLFLKEDGTVWACGRNNKGQLGDGTTTDRDVPVQVSGLSGVVAIAAGLAHSLFLRKDSTVWACGDNFYGQLGNPMPGAQSVPVQVQGLSQSIGVAAGESHSLFLASDSTVWGCGYNFYGQLGDGSRTYRKIPVRVNLSCAVTGLEVSRDFQLPQVTIAPNPNNGYFVFDVRNPALLPGRLIIQDIQGRQLYSQRLFTTPVQLDLSPYPNGMYLLILETTQEMIKKSLLLHR